MADKRYMVNSRKNTWWNNRRISSGLTLSEIEELTGIKVVTICRNFCGFSMPTDEHIKIYCDAFDVPFDEGKAHFQQAAESYKPNAYTKKVKITTMSVEELQKIKAAEEKERIKMKQGRKITYKTFFNKLKEERGYTVYDVQSMLKSELGRSVSISNIYNYLTGRILPPTEIMFAFCDVFEVSTEKGISHFLHDHENFVQDEKTLKDAHGHYFCIEDTLCKKYSSVTKDPEIQNLIEENDNLLKDIDREKNDIFIEVLRDKLINMVNEAVFDEIDDEERCYRLKDLYYQINCTLYILHRFNTKGMTPKLKENTVL